MKTETLQSAVIQIAVLLGFGLSAAYFATNAASNLQSMGLATGFGFLDQTAGFDISFTVIPYDRENSTFLRVLMVGITNTLVVSLLGIVLATILGTAIGVFQLLDNWPLTRVCRVYIEFARNVPLLLQLLFWYSGVLATLPHQREGLSLFDAVYLNVRGLFIPWPEATPHTLPFALSVFIGVTIWIVLARRARIHREATGQSRPGHLQGIAVLVVLCVLTVATFGNPASWIVPELKGFNFKGGAWLPPEFVALLLGLTLYTAAFIAELVRGGINAVPSGQREAAIALGLRPWRVMRLVMIPQAMRIIVPPLTSQYLNMVKNSSLAVAIAYPDIVSVFTGTVLNQTGRAIEIVAITMLFYLTISLTISVFMNWYNRRVALVGKESS